MLTDPKILNRHVRDNRLIDLEKVGEDGLDGKDRVLLGGAQEGAQVADLGLTGSKFGIARTRKL